MVNQLKTQFADGNELLGNTVDKLKARIMNLLKLRLE